MGCWDCHTKCSSNQTPSNGSSDEVHCATTTAIPTEEHDHHAKGSGPESHFFGLQDDHEEQQSETGSGSSKWELMPNDQE